jgi:hypothetical protein
VWGVAGIIAAHRYGTGEARFIVLFACLAVVGLGSLAFHMTLRYYAQVSGRAPSRRRSRRTQQALDEVPMLFSGFAAFYTVVEDGMKPKYPQLMPALTVLSTLAIAVYFLLPQFCERLAVAHVYDHVCHAPVACRVVACCADAPTAGCVPTGAQTSSSSRPTL